MLARWIDPHIRRSVALAAILLSLTGLILARGRPISVERGPLVTTEHGPREVVHEPPIRPRDPVSSSTSFDTSGVSGRMALSHGRLLSSGTRSLFLELRVRGNPSAITERAPLAMMLVVDTSGSMAGQKIIDARNAAAALLGEMRDDDVVGLVRFSTDAELLVPLGRVADVRSRARDAIARLSANGNTNIGKAVRTATDELSARWLEGRVRRVAMVTDGRDTSGTPRSSAADIARREASRMTVSTLGIGVDYDDAYLAELAAAGHGNYEFLRDSSALARFLSRELTEASRTTADAVRFDLDLPTNARVRDVWGATLDTTGARPRIVIGSLFSGDERRAIVVLDVESGDAGTETRFAGNISFRPPGSERIEVAVPSVRALSVESPAEVEAGRDLSVLAQVTSITSSKRESEAAAAFARGDRKTAMELNAQSLKELDHMAAAASSADASRLHAQKKVYEQDNGVYATQPASPAPARAIGAREHKNQARELAY
jgi:Ca-activated chloride channel homolog